MCAVLFGVGFHLLCVWTQFCFVCVRMCNFFSVCVRVCAILFGEFNFVCVCNHFGACVFILCARTTQFWFVQFLLVCVIVLLRV